MQIKKAVTFVCSGLASVLAAIMIFADRSIQASSFSELLSAFNANHMGVFCVAVGGVFFFYKVFQPKSRRVKVLAALGGLVFAFCNVVGYNISHFDSLSRGHQTIYSGLFDFCLISGAFLLFYGGLSLLFDWLVTRPVSSKEYRELKWFGCNARSFFAVVGILLVLWSVYFVLFFPGITTWDSYYQIEQGMGFRQLTNENPFLHTLLEGAIIRLGTKLFGTIANGIALYTVVQMILIALAVSFVLVYMARRKVPLAYRIGTLCFFACHPVVAAYSVTGWKDVWISYFVLLYVVLLIEIAINKENFFKSNIHVFLLIVVILGFLFTKNTGVFVLLLSLPFLWIFARKHYRKIAIVTVVCLVVFAGVRYVVMPGLNIVSGHIREPFSVPLQQIARTVTKHGDDLTEEQKQIISEILPYEELSELYNPRLSDNVKSSLNEEVFQKDILKYAKCWLELGIQHPKTYVESFLANTYGYWYPETRYWQISTSSYYDILFMYRDNGWTVYDENVNEYEIDESYYARRSAVVSRYDHLRDIPGISTLFSLAFYFWAQFVLLLICILKKRYAMLLPFAVIATVLLTCLISPVHAECRYAFAAIISLPVLAAFVMRDDFSLTEKMGIQRRRSEEN